MFTRMSKVLLWIMVVAVVIASFGVGAEEEGVGIAIFFGGLIVLIFFGIFVELANNVLDIKNYIAKGGLNIGDVSSQAVNTQPITTYEPTWSCRKCGTINKTTSARCEECGEVNNSYSGGMLSQAVKKMEYEKQSLYNSSPIVQGNEAYVNTNTTNTNNVNGMVNNTSNIPVQKSVEISNSGMNLSQVAQRKEGQNQIGWYCRICGEKNAEGSLACKSCGNYK